jgi:flavorubredoxin
MMEKIKELVEKYKQWSQKHPTRNVFLMGFVLGFIIGAILC